MYVTQSRHEKNQVKKKEKFIISQSRLKLVKI